MPMRESSAVNIAPLFIRLALGLTFIWAGLGKVIPTVPVSADEAATLIELGVTPAAASSSQPDPQPDPQPDAPEDPLPEPEPEAPEDLPPADPDDEGEPATDDQDGEPVVLAAAFRQPSDVDSASDSGADTDAPTPAVTAAPGEVMRLHEEITLLLKRSSEPKYDAESGEQLDPIVPDFVGRSPWTKVLAWSAAITEIGAGALVLVGFFTRIAALGLAGTMGVALWLTQIGPAIQSNATQLGFLPMYTPWYDATQWVWPLWQLALLCAAFSLLFSGAGALSMDRLIFKPRQQRD
ncbi:MAG: DoxX family protein [Planctomycetota bacterium]